MGMKRGDGFWNLQLFWNKLLNTILESNTRLSISCAKAQHKTKIWYPLPYAVSLCWIKYKRAHKLLNQEKDKVAGEGDTIVNTVTKIIL